MIIASDGRLDKSAPTSIAGRPSALLASIPSDLINRWSHEEQYIDHVEQAALVLAILDERAFLRGRDAIWFIDNTVALSAIIKGSSSEPDIARAAAATYLTLAFSQQPCMV